MLKAKNAFGYTMALTRTDAPVRLETHTERVVYLMKRIESGWKPTRAEIARKLGTNPSTASRLVAELCVYIPIVEDVEGRLYLADSNC